MNSDGVHLLLSQYKFRSHHPCASDSDHFFKGFIYLLMRDRERERGRDPGRGRSQMQDLIPSPGISPELRAEAQLLRHPGVSHSNFQN